MALMRTFYVCSLILILSHCSSTINPNITYNDLGSVDTIVYGALTGLSYADPRVELLYTTNLKPGGVTTECNTYYTRNAETHKIDTLYFIQKVTGNQLLMRSINFYGSKVKEYNENILLNQPQGIDHMPGPKEEVLRSLGFMLKRIPDGSKAVYIGTLDVSNLNKLEPESENEAIEVAVSDTKSLVDFYMQNIFLNLDFSTAQNYTLNVMKNTYSKTSEGVMGPQAANDELLDIIMIKSME
ncbi:MAG: hypothetical protein OCD01_13075 [Fibrobacterales bacterium]